MVKRSKIRDRILTAAEREFENKRYHELKLDDVATAAGVGKGTIYRYFKNKEDLICQLATLGHDELCEVLESYHSDASLPLKDILEKVVTALSAFYCGRHTLTRIMEQEGRLESLQHRFRQELRARRERLVHLTMTILTENDRHQELRRDIDPRIMANLLLGLVRARDRNFGSDPAAMPPPRLIVSMFLDGARQRPAPSTP